ncbi:MAG TPA: MBL fold metallo-hydrolase [Solirubrobacteraceae bacterium]|jgi:glyoxylase-like metal-dependent hydrolase (beta-lactamase superfamily II)|nr:MBL fold metallo-hydrolase [Solirubrobacteraceae bacterium]
MTSTRVSRWGFVNAYLVQEDDGITVVDTGIPGTASRIVAAAQRLGLSIVRIVLTHAHFDHVGSVDALVGELRDVEVAITARDARLLNGDKQPEPGEPQVAVKGRLPKLKTEVTGRIAVGDRVGSLEVVAAPGHTPGHIALLDTRDRTLYCGDAYATLGGVDTSAKPSFPFPLPALATWHRPTALASAKALRALDPTRLAPGHGKPLESPGEAMDRAIAKAS